MSAPILQFKRGNAGVAGTVPALRPGEPAISLNNFDLFVGIDTSVSNNKFFGSHRYWAREDGSTSLRLKLVDKDGTNSINLKAPDTVAGIVTYTFPSTAINGYYLKTNASGDLSWEQVVSNINIAADTGTTDSVSTGATITFSGGEGIDTAVSNDTITISAELASTSNAGVASFSSSDFIVTNGLVELANSIDFANAEFDNILVTGISTFNGAVTGTISTATKATQLSTARSFELTGDVLGSAVLFDGTGNVSIAATIQPNSVALGTDTTGNYVATITGTANEVEVSGSGSESAAITIGLPDAVVVGTSLSSPTIRTNLIKSSDTNTTAITITNNDVTIADDLTVSGNLYVNGSTTQVNTAAITVEDRTIELGVVDGSAPSTTTTWDLGVLFNYCDTTAKKSAIVWEQNDQRFKLGSVVSDGGGTGNNNPQLTVSTYAPLEIGSLWITDCAGTSQVISCTGTERNLENINIDLGTF